MKFSIVKQRLSSGTIVITKRSEAKPVEPIDEVKAPVILEQTERRVTIPVVDRYGRMRFAVRRP